LPAKAGPATSTIGRAPRNSGGRASRAVGRQTTSPNCAGPPRRIGARATCSASRPVSHRAPRRAVPALRARIPHASALRGVLGVSLRVAVPRNPSNSPRLSSHHAAPAALLPDPFARCAGGGAGLRETLKVPAPGAQRQARCAGNGSGATHNVTGCARRNGFRHPLRRLSPALRRCTRATGSSGYARLGSLSPALASSLRRVGRLRRAFVGGPAPQTPTD
jgi:hypothetical protein